MTSNPAMPCRNISELCPTLERACNEFIKRCKDKGLNVLVTQTYRSAAYQASLYAQGRTKPGSIVTNLNGSKNNESPHQFRIAFDICKNVKGHEYDDLSFFKACGKIWTDMGGVWGGNWSGFVDNPHFEFTNNQGYNQFRNGYVFPNNFQMPWEKVLPTAPIVTPNVTKKEDDEVVENISMKVNGVMQIVPRILKDGRNYIQLNDLKEKGVLNASYDEKTKIVSIDKK